MTNLDELAFEALCSAFWGLPESKFLGERPDPVDRSNVAWFLLQESERPVREDPHKVRVAIRLSPVLDGVVEVRAEWPNVAGGEMLVGQQTFHIGCAAITQSVAQAATEDVVRKILGIYADVCSGTGVAEAPERVLAAYATDTAVDENDMAVDAEEFNG